MCCFPQKQPSNIHKNIDCAAVRQKNKGQGRGERCYIGKTYRCVSKYKADKLLFTRQLRKINAKKWIFPNDTLHLRS